MSVFDVGDFLLMFGDGCVSGCGLIGFAFLLVVAGIVLIVMGHTVAGSICVALGLGMGVLWWVMDRRDRD